MEGYISQFEWWELKQMVSMGEKLARIANNVYGGGVSVFYLSQRKE